MDWITTFTTELPRFAGAGTFGLVVYLMLGWRKQSSEDRAAARAGGLEERRQTVQEFSELTDDLKEQLRDCLAREDEWREREKEWRKIVGELEAKVREKEHETNNLLQKINLVKWLESTEVTPAGLRWLADDKEARESGSRP